MENINLSTTSDRHTTTILLAVPAPLVIIGNRQTTFHWHRQPPVSAIGHKSITSIGHRHISITILGLSHILLLYLHQSLSAIPLITNHHPFHLPIFIPLIPRYGSKDTCPKTVSTGSFETHWPHLYGAGKPILWPAKRGCQRPPLELP